MVAPFIPTNEAYSYDATGNRLSSSGASQSSNGSHNRLQTDGTFNYVYDNEGNTTRRTRIATGAVTDYTWDHRNRLIAVVERVSATGAMTRQTLFTYDAFDNRVAKRADVDGNGTWERFEVTTWADGQEAMRWVDSDGSGTGQILRLTNRYLWADSVDQLLSDEQYWNNTGMAINATTSSTVAGNTLWTLGDHLSSIRDLLDNNGVIREHQVFDSYGRLVREVDYNSAGQVIASNDAWAVDTVFGYTGRSWDTDVNLQYNRARWYDPQTGRWLSQDPIGFAAGDANLYRYVGNKATYRRDPSGLKIRGVGSTGNLMDREADGATDMVPGDWAYIYNDAHQYHVSRDNSGKPWDHGLEGENLICAGYMGFWGHFGPGNTYFSFDKWMKDVGSWKSRKGEASKPRLEPRVQFPNIGIESVEDN